MERRSTIAGDHPPNPASQCEMPMCFDDDSRPPIRSIAGGALDSGELTISAADGNRFLAFRARPAAPSGAGVLILPDNRGLHPYYRDLALRFAENGIDALAIDYFGRTAGIGQRPPDFDPSPHLAEVRWAQLSGDIAAGVAELRVAEGGAIPSLFTTGFCFGGRLSFLAATLGLELAGVIGFYGVPVGAGRSDIPAPVDLATQIAAPVLGLFGGADPVITPEAVARFDAALVSANVDHELISYPDAPHSFFDKKAAENAEASQDAWARTLDFIRSRTAPPG
jgi:carboxymethylenebutenolidase